MEIYLDHAATTTVREEVLKEMLPYFTQNYGNPSSIYQIARKNKKAIEKSRVQIAKAIGANDKKEIYFTSGGSESDNWVIKGIAESYQGKGKHIITTQIEHHAILNSCKYLEEKGYEITYLKVDSDGKINLEELEKSIKKDTILISIMFANNEIGTIQPIKKIGEIARKHNIIFHTDAVQAIGQLKIDVEDMKIDLLSMSGHKFYGPKGIGALYIRKGIELKSFIHGGSQEKGLRAGTENVAAIVGIGKAIELAENDREIESKRLIKLRNKLIDELLKSIPYSNLNGHKTDRLPSNANLSFDFVEGESILLMLDKEKIYASSGSACASSSSNPSHVLLSIGLSPEKAHGSLRMTLGRDNSENDINKVIEILPKIVERMRAMSPMYDEFCRLSKKN